MDWFLYDRDLHHERVKQIFVHSINKDEMMSNGVVPLSSLLALDIYLQALNLIY